MGERKVRLKDLPESWSHGIPSYKVGDRITLTFASTGRTETLTIVDIGPTTATLEPVTPPR